MKATTTILLIVLVNQSTCTLESLDTSKISTVQKVETTLEVCEETAKSLSYPRNIEAFCVELEE